MSEHNHTITAVSGGNIRRGRVVFLSDEWTVLEASVNTSFPPLGISGPNSRKAPGTPFDTSLYHAQSGDEVFIFTAGYQSALAECGGTVTAGKRVTWDSTARIVDSVSGGGLTSLAISFNWEVGTAMESGAAGDVIRIQVHPSQGYRS